MEDLTISDEEFDPSDTDSESSNTNNKKTFELETTVTLLPQITKHDASKKPSPVWNFMHEKVDSNKTAIVRCDYCPQEYSIKTSTGVLTDHLNKQHKYNITLNQKHKSLAKKPYGNEDTQRIKECTTSILNFIISNQALFKIVKSTCFCKMINILDLRYISPTCTYLKEKI
ncbi:19691_t:CDS:1, partial [Racocetra fulgida]